MIEGDDFEVSPWVARRVRRIVWTLVALAVAIPVLFFLLRASFAGFPLELR